MRPTTGMGLGSLKGYVGNDCRYSRTRADVPLTLATAATVATFATSATGGFAIADAAAVGLNDAADLFGAGDGNDAADPFGAGDGNDAAGCPDAAAGLSDAAMNVAANTRERLMWFTSG